MRDPAEYDLPRGTTWICRDTAMLRLGITRSTLFAFLADYGVAQFDARKLEGESRRKGRKRFYDWEQVIRIRENHEGIAA